MSPAASPRWPMPEERLEKRIAILPDGTILARSGKVEYGQGIRAGFAKIVAEELAVPLQQVQIELGETDHVPWDMGTFGSLSTAMDGQALRRAAAYARRQLLERASHEWGLPTEQLTISNGWVSASDGRRVSYTELVAQQPLSGIVPDDMPCAQMSVLDDGSPMRLEAYAILTGQAKYPADVRLPGMLRGHVLQPPSPSARLVQLDDRAARALPGVIAIVHEGDFIGVVAERSEQALAATRALEVEWAAGQPAAEAPVEAMLRQDTGLEQAFAGAAQVAHAHYHTPHIAHASIGPSAATVDVRDDGVHLYVATQRPFGLRDEVAARLTIPATQVHVHPQTMGGQYGRGNNHEAILGAVRLSRAVKRPVQIQWTRAEEFRYSPHRPTLDADITAALDASGRIIAWRTHCTTNPHTYGSGVMPLSVLEATSGRNVVPVYRLPCAEVYLRVEPGAVRTGAFRSLAAAPNVFAIESFMDELAAACHADPVAFRLRHIGDERLKRVLETVARQSRWGEQPAQAGRGLGVACTIYNHTYIAQVAEVAVSPSGRVRLERVWCAVDAGRIVHADGARNQIEGGILQAASWTLLEALEQQGGIVSTANWRDYPILTCRDAPRQIEVELIDAPSQPSTGIGEPGSVPTAAAIANAVYAACGARVRSLPLRPASVYAAQMED